MTADPLNNTDLVDLDHAACLCDVGLPGYVAAVAVDSDGEAHLLLAEWGSVGDEAKRYDPLTAQAPHDQTGPLPLEYVRRLTISSRRTHRCGRATRTTGKPCRMEVAWPGQACGFHNERNTSNDHSR